MLKQELQTNQIQALKEKNSLKLNTLRLILSQIKNREIDKQSELTDDEIISVIKKIAKELRESIDAFKKGNRPDLVTDHEKQLAIVLTYLPPEISDAELKKEVDKIIANNQTIYQKSPKAIIGICIRELKNKADSSRILKILSSV